MFNRKTTLTIASTLLVLAVSVVPVWAASNYAVLISSSSTGIGGNGLSLWPSITADGHYVVFGSNSNNLIAGDTNDAFDTFRKDRVTGAIELVSVPSGGGIGNNGSGEPYMTEDGRFIGFSSSATNIVSGDTNAEFDVFLRDMQSGTTTLVSENALGSAPGNGGSEIISISNDGRYVAFRSRATDLAVGFTDTNGEYDIFLRDLQTGITTNISVSTGGTQANDESNNPVISGNGQFVVYYSRASNLVASDTNGRFDIFCYDRISHETIRVSMDASGNQASDESMNPSISRDGRYIAFSSVASDLVASDINGQYDVFVKDVSSGAIELVSKDSTGNLGNNSSDLPSISPDGRFVGYVSMSDNLVTVDTNSSADVFLFDRSTSQTTRVSEGNGGVESNGYSNRVDISVNGRYLVFESAATNFSASDTNPFTDIYFTEVLGGSNPVTDDDSDEIDPATIPSTGFAPGRVTSLQVQPAAKRYSAQDMVLEIPALAIKQVILDVPFVDGGWDVAWLGDSIGFLQGTAFPTHAGNSVLTGHVYNADGQPGPFVNLSTLKWGDRIDLHAWDQDYVYEVRSVDDWVTPKDTYLLTKHEELPWLTLITCKGFDEQSNSYHWRTVVRAVQVEVK